MTFYSMAETARGRSEWEAFSSIAGAHRARCAGPARTSRASSGGRPLDHWPVSSCARRSVARLPGSYWQYARLPMMEIALYLVCFASVIASISRRTTGSPLRPTSRSCSAMGYGYVAWLVVFEQLGPAPRSPHGPSAPRNRAWSSRVWPARRKFQTRPLLESLYSPSPWRPPGSTGRDRR